jgi:hypothetical protein
VAFGNKGMDMAIDCLDTLIDWFIKSGVVSWTRGACESGEYSEYGNLSASVGEYNHVTMSPMERGTKYRSSPGDRRNLSKA